MMKFRTMVTGTRLMSECKVVWWLQRGAEPHRHPHVQEQTRTLSHGHHTDLSWKEKTFLSTLLYKDYNYYLRQLIAAVRTDGRSTAKLIRGRGHAQDCVDTKLLREKVIKSRDITIRS